jgi:hypothetical protein
MTRASLFSFARVALTTVMVVMAAFGHLYGKDRHHHGSSEQRVALIDAAKSDAARAVSISGHNEFSLPSTPRPDGGLSESGCGCCFSGCGCCSTALWRQNDDFAPPTLIVSESRAASPPGLPSGLRPEPLFKPPRLSA